jgi:hypothetical protein
MADIVVLGGYGRVGSLCVRELLASTRAHVVVAGRNVQRAESTALALGERTSAIYCDVHDPRTFSDELKSASLVVACSAAAPFALLEWSLETKVPLVVLTPFYLEPRGLMQLGERAWEAQTQIVLAAGAVPGLVGVAAEALVREAEALDEIRIACTGLFEGTSSARNDVAALRTAWKPATARSRRARSQWTFPAPVGRRLVRSTQSLDLVGFSQSHTVERVTYLEADTGLVARGVARLLQQTASPEFSLSAEAFETSDVRIPSHKLTLFAADVPTAAAASVGVVVRALLAGGAPAGLLTPREVVNPGPFLEHIAARGITVHHS